MTEQNEKEPTRLVITFPTEGTIFFDMQVVGDPPFPGQLIVVGDYLVNKGRDLTRQAEIMMQQQVMQEQEQNKIIVPKPKLVS